MYNSGPSLIVAHYICRSLWMVSLPSCLRFGEESGANPPPIIQITRSCCVNLAWKHWTSEQEDGCEQRHLLPSHLSCSSIYSSLPIGSGSATSCEDERDNGISSAARVGDNDRHAYGCGSRATIYMQDAELEVTYAWYFPVELCVFRL